MSNIAINTMRFGLVQLTRIFFVLAIGGLTACSPPAANVYTGETMGTYYRVSYYGEGDYLSDIQGILTGVNNSMSSWLPDSEINLFNAKPVGTPVQLSPDLCEVVDFALQLKELSDGAYDISIGKVVADMGFGPKLESLADSVSAEGDEVSNEGNDLSGLQPQKIIASETLRLQGCELTRLDAAARLDLSSIAKGFAVDQIGDFLESKGLDQYLVDIGGELKAGNYKPDGSPWRIAVEVPSVSGGVQHVIELVNMAIATSGDYRNFREEGGEVASHLIDPRSGGAAQSRITSISVLNASAMRADAWATALFVMGPPRAMYLANHTKTPVYMLLRSEQNGGAYDLGTPEEAFSVEVSANSYWRDHFE